MAKKSKKHTILCGVKVSSKRLSEWGSQGGRPLKYASNAERQRAKRLRKKQAELGETVQLDGRKTYGEVKIKRYIICPQCGKVNRDLKQYFNEKGEYIPKTWWWDSARDCKTNIRENIYYCLKCYHAFSFLRGEIKAEEIKTVIKKAGTNAERSRRFRNKTRKAPQPNH